MSETALSGVDSRYSTKKLKTYLIFSSRNRKRAQFHILGSEYFYRRLSASLLGEIFSFFPRDLEESYRPGDLSWWSTIDRSVLPSVTTDTWVKAFSRSILTRLFQVTMLGLTRSLITLGCRKYCWKMDMEDCGRARSLGGFNPIFFAKENKPMIGTMG